MFGWMMGEISSIWWSRAPHVFMCYWVLTLTQSSSALFLPLICPPLDWWGHRRPALLENDQAAPQQQAIGKKILLLFIYWVSSFLGKNYFIGQGEMTTAQEIPC